jgi:hypothetical protein
MRRAGIACLGCLAGIAAADPAPTQTLTVEGGAEADSNIRRAETGGGLMTERVGGPVMRFGGRLDRRGRVQRGAYTLATSMLARVVGNGEARDENVALLAGDLRWARAIGKRPVALGAGVAYADALQLSSGTNGGRAFRTAAADAMLVLRKDDDRSLTLTAGPRYFHYKPLEGYDWWGPAFTARFDLGLWESPESTRTLELAAILGFEARIYDALASARGCPENAPPDPSCYAPTSLPRRDRYQRAGVELTYTGRFVGSVGYQLAVVDSNSFGQSVVRHRATLSATMELPRRWIGTVLATLQIDRYLDGLILEKDLQHQEYTSLDDANRSSLQIRLARRVNDVWSIEGRFAVWRDLGGNLPTDYRRELVYVGAVYTK